MTNPELTEVARAIREHDRFLVTTHENPDGDALGSLLAMTLGLRDLGKDAVMFLSGDVPLPAEYRFMPLDDLLRGMPPADATDRVVLAVDCASDSRLGAAAETLLKAPLVIDVDHHHDNTRFGHLNCVVADASSTGEILRDLVGELGLPLTPGIAEPLYVAVVTDTGRFQYSNTTPKALRLAAELIEAGVDVQRVFQAVYESIQFAKLKLLARALERAQVYEGGRIVVSFLRAADFVDVGAEEPFSEGIIDFLRAVEGADLAVLIREPPPSRPDAPRHRVSLRSNAQGYDTVIGERGITLSGGQRQRVAIARALAVDPRILILDDATASVDATTEAQIRAGLREVMSGRTTLIIAHRLSTIALADEVVVLDGGRIVARGTHDELLETSPVYREIHEHGLLERQFADAVEARGEVEEVA